MGTSWASVITDDAMLIINDIRLNTELAENPALFFRKMSFYMKNAVPRFNRPPEMKEWLGYTEPVFNAAIHTVIEETTENLVIELGLTGYDLMSAGTLTDDVYGNPVYTSIPEATYNADTGSVTIPATESDPIQAGTVISMDFYTDGTFDNELTAAQRRILALCIQYAWEMGFVNDWLNRTPRAKDRSFDAGNVSNQTRANTERLNAVRRTLDDEMTGYAQSCEYMQATRNAGQTAALQYLL